jgi:general L-amino acid transport system permease protein
MRRNLFGSWFDTILTVIGVLILYWVVKGFLTWAFTIAEWEVVTANLRLILIGQFPTSQVGRLWLWLGFLVFLSGNSIGIWARKSNFAVVMLVSPALLALLPFEDEPRLWLVTMPCSASVGGPPNGGAPAEGGSRCAS